MMLMNGFLVSHLNAAGRNRHTSQVLSLTSSAPSSFISCMIFHYGDVPKLVLKIDGHLEQVFTSALPSRFGRERQSPCPRAGCRLRPRRKRPSTKLGSREASCSPPAGHRRRASLWPQQRALRPGESDGARGESPRPSRGATG